ncbi:YbaK/EbsC family protein [Amaricoccus sp.]|uniref:YbaK/EbsC family protein n=1 Tax=Amaricoccus sp. TaxID=1872485 RepID=UPI001B5AE21A|nr:YbaK/EbsC family protein [Amaricoccus sp.]MBP7241040.1 YbaK/EbsC family protein [Amaricoccus sp.]
MSTSRTAEPEARLGSVDRVAAEAARLGLDIAVVRLDESTRTAAEAARACGCEVDQIVKSIVFRVAGSDRHVLFLTCGGARVDPARASALAGAALEKADAAGVRAFTGFAIGGVSPLGHLNPIAVWMDPALFRFATIWAAAGSPNHVFSVAPEPLRAAANAAVAPFTA